MILRDSLQEISFQPGMFFNSFCRLQDEDVHVTFDSGTSALESLELDGRVVSNQHFLQMVMV